MEKRNLLRAVVFAGFAVIFAAVVFAVNCKALGDTGSNEDVKKPSLPVAIPLESLTVEDSQGNDLIRGFKQDKLDYEILFPKEQINKEVLVKGVAASNKAKVLVSIGATIIEKDSLLTKLPQHSVTVKVTVTEETGRVSTVYQVLLQLDEDSFLPELYGSVTISGKFDKDGLTAVLSTDSGLLDSKATFTWYRNNVEINSAKGAAGKIYPVTEADNNAVIKVEVTADGKNGSLMAIRKAPRWEDSAAVASLIDKVKSLIEQNIKTTVVGDPAENPHSYAPVLDLIEALNILMEGMEQKRETKGSDGSITTELVRVYDRAQIADKTAELEALLTGSFSHISKETIIVRKLVFGYAGEKEQTVKLMSQKDAVYEIELIGASGGHVATNGLSPAFDAGGKGGHVIARYNLLAGSEYILRVGGEGSSTAHYNSATQTWERIGYLTPVYMRSKPGGWPNGGAGGAGNWNLNIMPAGGGGGGSTDIRLKTATGVFDGSYTDPRFMVAAGGGGSAQFAMQENGKNVRALGGDADQLGMAAQEDKRLIASLLPQPGAAPDDKGQRGVDGYAESGNAEGRGGGGGGSNGGGAITSTSSYNGKNKVTGSGAGGSNRIKMDSSYVSNSNTIDVIQTFGNGLARIQWVGYKTN